MNKYINKVRNMKPFYRFIWLLLPLFIFLAIMDIWGIPFWGTENVKLFAQVFWVFAFAIVLGMALSYYNLTRDKSETIAFISGFIILMYTGLEDIFFYLIKDRVLPASMPHLFEHGIIDIPAKAMGLTTVTPLSLIISVSIGITVTYFLITYLHKKL